MRMTSSSDSNAAPTPERFREELRQRLARFSLELHPDKAPLNRVREVCKLEPSGTRPRREAGDFLGLTHVCGRSRRFLLRRQTERQRITAKLHEVSTEAQHRRHQSLPEQGRWLSARGARTCGVLGVPTNGHALCAFWTQVARHWYRALRRRGQRHRLDWGRISRHVRAGSCPARIMHPWPEQRFDVRTRDENPVR